MGLPEALRTKAMHLLSEYIDQLSEETVHELIAGRQVLSRQLVDHKLVQARALGIEETYEFLAKIKKVSDIRALLIPITPPAGLKLPSLIDHTLMSTFGRTFTPPPPPPKPRASPSTGSRAKKQPEPQWNATEVATVLRSLTSVPRGEEYLTSTRASVEQLKELVGVLGISTSYKKSKPKFIESIVWLVIGARGAHEHAMND